MGIHHNAARRPLGRAITGEPDSALYETRRPGHEVHTVASALRVLTVDDHSVVRRGIHGILSSEFPGAVVGEAATPQEALDAVYKQDWDLILLDVSLPGRSGIELLAEIRVARPKVPILMLSMHSEGHFAIRALKAGAAGYITKDSPVEILLQAVRRLLAGGKFITSSLAERLAAQVGSDPTRLPHESLSDREFDVLRLIGSGKTVGEIAEQLHLSVKTISTYRARVMTKMAMKNNAELVQYSIRNNLVE